jgi:hypothetical protein
MTITNHATTDWPAPAADPNLDGIHVLTHKNNDYLRRIHWWVRLFGIVWIVIPVVAFLAAVAFGLGIISMSRAENINKPTASASFAKCLTEGFSVTECGRWYPS